MKLVEWLRQFDEKVTLYSWLFFAAMFLILVLNVLALVLHW